MRCRVCTETALMPLRFDIPWTDQTGRWWRCLACGSDTSDSQVEELQSGYDRLYAEHILGIAGDVSAAASLMDTNLQWFDDHAKQCPNRDFLDIGCNEGAGLHGMAARKWSVHGFDINPVVKTGPHITISPSFRSSLFPRQYSAILCREVVEHVREWRALLTEAYMATIPNGLFQIQTPRPWTSYNPIPYQKWHLFLLSPMALRYWLERVGFSILDYRLWDYGQAYMCRRLP